ncbi:hypothetical protein [Megavirus chiliensis]|uniref:Uncharacterized protein n=3 Tax=Megavirus TaxID=3044761 RepID=G5CSL1_9VIRU|nr:hypothetical protein MegaChil _gp0947 [Megavirus chiliensis]AEQ33286.1 hypothetical protein [Megavirus chiliensis]AEX62011.1 hypothetical protein c7_R1149 [Megavirus courdo7]AUV58886.1 hypothetical protein [Bandra megavirus]
MHKIKRTTLFVRQSYSSSARISTQLLLSESKIYTSRSINITDCKRNQKIYTRHYYSNTKIFKKENMDRYLKETEEIIFSFMNGFTDGCIWGSVIILCLIDI